jgi:hypothetical protein
LLISFVFIEKLLPIVDRGGDTIIKNNIIKFYQLSLDNLNIPLPPGQNCNFGEFLELIFKFFEKKRLLNKERVCVCVRKIPEMY